MVTPSLTSLILAGGASRRMGQDKAAICYDGQPMLRHSCQIAQAVSDRVIVLSAPHQQASHAALLPPHCELWLEPPSAEPAGPLVALAWALPRMASEWVLLLACDMPNLAPDALALGRSQLSALSSLIYLPRSGPIERSRWEPLCAFYRSTLADSLAQFVRTGGRSFQPWIDQLAQMGAVQPWDLPAPLLHNCNRPEDLRPR